MTIQQLFVMFFAYLAGLPVVAYFTRATSRRIVGALAGGAVGGLLVFGDFLWLTRSGCGACR